MSTMDQATDADWTRGEPRLLLHACCGCGHVWYLPRLRCARCGSSDIESIPSPGDGTCVAATVVRLAELGEPVGLVLVALDEGPVVIGRTTSDHRSAAPGDRVGLEFRTFPGAERPLPTFCKGPSA